MKNSKFFLGGAIGAMVGVAIDQLLIGKKAKKSLLGVSENNEKLYEFYLLLIQWLRVHHEGKNVVDYFRKNNVQTIAIYGMKELGEALLEELKDSDIEVKYGIDRDADNLYVAVDVYRPDEELGKVDMIVVTAVHYFDSIVNDLQDKTEARIVSLEDVVWEA